MKGNPLLRAARTNAVLAANQKICMEKNKQGSRSCKCRVIKTRDSRTPLFPGPSSRLKDPSQVALIFVFLLFKKLFRFRFLL